jgi:hypothetical protein
VEEVAKCSYRHLRCEHLHHLQQSQRSPPTEHSLRQRQPAKRRGRWHLHGCERVRCVRFIRLLTVGLNLRWDRCQCRRRSPSS